MTTVAYTLTDSATMLRRNLQHQRRYPSLTLMLVGMPIVFLLLFVYVFGGQLGAGLDVPAAAHGGRSAYLNYVVPGILIMTVAVGRAGHRDLGRDGHDRGHHRPVPHHGHRPSSCADRPRDRQPDPDPRCARPRDRVLRSRSASDRPPIPSSGWRRSACWRLFSLRVDLAVDRARPRREERRNGQQHADVPHPAAVPQQRFRPDRYDARPGCGSSPSTSRSPRLSRPCGACLLAAQWGATQSLRLLGASASRWPATSGQSASTIAVGLPPRADRLQPGRWTGPRR